MKETLARYIVVFHDRHAAPDQVFVHSTESSALAHVQARMLFRLTSDIFPDKTAAPDDGYLAVLRLCLKGGVAAIRDALKIWNELQADDDWIRVEEVSYYNRDDFNRDRLAREVLASGAAFEEIIPDLAEPLPPYLFRHDPSLDLPVWLWVRYHEQAERTDVERFKKLKELLEPFNVRLFYANDGD